MIIMIKVIILFPGILHVCVGYRSSTVETSQVGNFEMISLRIGVDILDPDGGTLLIKADSKGPFREP